MAAGSSNYGIGETGGHQARPYGASQIASDCSRRGSLTWRRDHQTTERRDGRAQVPSRHGPCKEMANTLKMARSGRGTPCGCPPHLPTGSDDPLHFHGVLRCYKTTKRGKRERKEERSSVFCGHHIVFSLLVGLAMRGRARLRCTQYSLRQALSQGVEAQRVEVGFDGGAVVGEVAVVAVEGDVGNVADERGEA